MVEVVVLVEAAVMHVTLMVTAVLAEHMPVMVEVMEVMVDGHMVVMDGAVPAAVPVDIAVTAAPVVLSPYTNVALSTVIPAAVEVAEVADKATHLVTLDQVGVVESEYTDQDLVVQAVLWSVLMEQLLLTGAELDLVAVQVVMGVIIQVVLAPETTVETDHCTTLIVLPEEAQFLE